MLAMVSLSKQTCRTSDPCRDMSMLVIVCQVHTMNSISSWDAVVQGPGDFGAQALTALVQALVPALLMNICIVGMNQIFDVEIDKINKPYLPLASGEWTLQTGISVAVGTGLASVLLSLYVGSKPLLATVIGSLLLGIAYSVDLPFLRWKKYPILAMGCILSVRYWLHPCNAGLVV